MANGLMAAAQGTPQVKTKEYKKPYKPGFGGIDPSAAQKFGLGTAKNILEGTVSRPGQYPEDISGKLKGPAQADYYQNVAYSPYQSLTGGDFTKLQGALTTPIMEQDRLARERLENQYSARGLYGSGGGGLMSSAMAAQEGAKEGALSGAYANALALQQKEAKQQFAADAAAADQLNRYRAGQQAYNLGQDQRQIDFENQQLAAARQYGLDRQAWQNAQDQIGFDRASQLAGLGTSGAGLQSQQDIARRQADAAQKSALYQGLGSLAGAFAGSGYGEKLAQGAGDALSSGTDWISSLFD